MSADPVYLQQTLRDVVHGIDEVLGHEGTNRRPRITACSDCMDVLGEIRKQAQDALDDPDDGEPDEPPEREFVDDPGPDLRAIQYEAWREK